MREVGLVLLGALCGLVVGTTSTGGGALLTPGLLFFGVPPAVAIGSDLLIASVIRLFGGGVYALRRQVHWPSVGWLACGSIPAALLAVGLLNRLSTQRVNALLPKAVGVALLLAGAASLARVLWRAPQAQRPMPRPWVTVLLGAATGLLVSTTSIGSGSMLLCVLALLFPLPAQALVGTDLIHALALSGFATLAQLASGRVDFRLAAWVLAGGIPGVILGARMASAVPERAMRGALACILVGLGLHFTFSGALQAPSLQMAESRPGTTQ